MIRLNYGLPQLIDMDEYSQLFHDIHTQIQYPDARSSQNISSLLPQFQGREQFEDGEQYHRQISYVPGRKDYVIQRLYDDGKISLSDALDAMIYPIEFVPVPDHIARIRAPHFVYYIRDMILNNQSLGISEQQLYQ